MPARQTRRSDQEWLQLITECRQSGLSDKAWTELHDIPSSSFYNAVSRLRKNACTIPEPTGTTPMLDLTSNKQDVVQIDILPFLCKRSRASAGNRHKHGKLSRLDVVEHMGVI